jgi:antitoxin component YwqK of YwqJK toxin-antitoxin module
LTYLLFFCIFEVSNCFKSMRGSIAKYLLAFCLILFFSTVFAQTEERPQWAPRSDKSRNVTDEMGRKQGLWKYYSLSHVLMYEITFLNDIKHGPCVRHNQGTGIVTEESNYFNGKRDGDFKKYTTNGTLVAEGQYTDGRRTGSWTTYFPVNGEKRTEGSYDNGQKSGAWKYYSSKGQMKASGEYKFGSRDGTWVFYNNEGQPEEKKYQKGREVGVVSATPSSGAKNKNKKKGNQSNPKNQTNPQNQGNKSNTQNQETPNN